MDKAYTNKTMSHNIIVISTMLFFFSHLHCMYAYGSPVHIFLIQM